MRYGKVVIPARMNSSRFPGKLMKEINGMPIIEHVWRRACLVIPKDDIVVTTDSDIILSHMRNLGAVTHKSGSWHESGTSRAREYLNFDAQPEFLVILQGDEALIRPTDLASLYDFVRKNPEFDFVNTVSKLAAFEELNDLSVVKCTIDSKMKIMYMFRANPFRNPEASQEFIFSVNGLFALSRSASSSILGSQKGLCETESIEQLQYLSSGYPIFAFETPEHLTSVNTPEDLKKVQDFLSSSNEQIKILHSYS